MSEPLDPLFRQRLKVHHRDLTVQFLKAQPGTRTYFKLDAALRSNEALYVELFREAIQPVHSQPQRKEKTE